MLVLRYFTLKFQQSGIKEKLIQLLQSVSVICTFILHIAISGRQSLENSMTSPILMLRQSLTAFNNHQPPEKIKTALVHLYFMKGPKVLLKSIFKGIQMIY